MDVVFNALLFGFVVVLAGLVEVRCVVYCFVVEFVVWGLVLWVTCGWFGWLFALVLGWVGCLIWNGCVYCVRLFDFDCYLRAPRVGGVACLGFGLVG